MEGATQAVDEMNSALFKQQQAEALVALNRKADEEYQVYLSKYPEVEKATFPKKEAEATAYGLDNTTPTPYLLRLTKGDIVARDTMVAAILGKVQELADNEQTVVDTRNAIKACATIEDLALIAI